LRKISAFISWRDAYGTDTPAADSWMQAALRCFSGANFRGMDHALGAIRRFLASAPVCRPPPARR
jgi:hypothetical protein